MKLHVSQHKQNQNERDTEQIETQEGVETQSRQEKGKARHKRAESFIITKYKYAVTKSSIILLTKFSRQELLFS